MGVLRDWWRGEPSEGIKEMFEDPPPPAYRGLSGAEFVQIMLAVVGEDSRVAVEHPEHGNWVVETGSFRKPKEPEPGAELERAAPPDLDGTAPPPTMEEAELEALEGLGAVSGPDGGEPGA